jgi:hypothetical protein
MKEAPACAGSVRHSACLFSLPIGLDSPAERELDLRDAHAAELACLD